MKPHGDATYLRVPEAYLRLDATNVNPLRDCRTHGSRSLSEAWRHQCKSLAWLPYSRVPKPIRGLAPLM